MNKRHKEHKQSKRKMDKSFECAAVTYTYISEEKMIIIIVAAAAAAVTVATSCYTYLFYKTNRMYAMRTCLFSFIYLFFESK